LGQHLRGGLFNATNVAACFTHWDSYLANSLGNLQHYSWIAPGPLKKSSVILESCSDIVVFYIGCYPSLAPPPVRPGALEREVSPMPLVTLFVILWTMAAGLTGTWTGNISERESDGTLAERGSAFLQLDQHDNVITGRVGPSSGAAHPIEKAVFSGD